MHTHDPWSRCFLAQAVTATAIATWRWTPRPPSRSRAAAKPPKLPADNAQAKALSYTEMPCR